MFHQKLLQARWFRFSKPAPPLPLLLHRAAGMHAAHASDSGVSAEFAMNPNTGALIPLRGSLKGGKEGREGGTPAVVGGSQERLPSPHSLLGTPALAHSSPMRDSAQGTCGKGMLSIVGML